MIENRLAMDALSGRWRELCLRCGAEPDSEWEMLLSRYGEAHRAYHTLSHISDCLMTFDRHPGLALHPDALEMAIWLHDIIYDPKAADNEKKSAAHAEEFLSGSEIAREVAGSILATCHSDEIPPPGDASLIVDIDLSILGAERSIYDRYAAAIRREYQHVPDEAYASGRAAVLSKFLARPRIFTTHAFAEALEEPARANLKDEIRRLTLPGAC